MKKETWLVTGGAGFIGSMFCRHILSTRKKVKILCFDALKQDNEDNLEEMIGDKRFTFVKGNVESREWEKTDINWQISGVNLVVNFSAETHVDRSLLDSYPFIYSNYLGVHNLLTLCTLNKIPLVHISTDEVYGEMIGMDKASEDSPLRPSNPYSATKAGADFLIKSFERSQGTRVKIIRPCNAYGPRQHPEKVIPLFITNLLEGKKCPLYGIGTQSRQWLYVEDTCKAIDTIIQKGKDGEIYNVNGCIELVNLEMTLKIIKMLKRRGMDNVQLVQDRVGHDVRYNMSDTKVRELGWTPSVQFETGLAHTISWYRQNKKWWMKRKGDGKDKTTTT